MDKQLFDKKYFWDVDYNSIDNEIHKRFIISRIIERGDWTDFRSLINYYGINRVKKEITEMRYIDRKTLNFCSVYFNIPLEKFRCYKSKRLINPF